MTSSGRGLDAEQQARSELVVDGNTRGGRPPISPLYKRLPHGPHRLERDQVIRNQRNRIHGAMIESVARNGYTRTSVKQVVALAGVSRRSFYELFANKEDCFVLTCDLIAQRDIRLMRKAYLAADGDVKNGLKSAFGELSRAVTDDHKTTALMLVEAQTAGAAGMMRLRRATASCEQMLAASMGESPGAGTLPAPIVRGIVGGLHGALSQMMRTESPPKQPRLAEQMLHWTLLFQTADSTRLEERMAASLSARLQSFTRRPDDDREPPSGDDRRLLMHEAVRFTALHGSQELTLMQIADEAGVSIDSCLSLFVNAESCYRAALQMVGDELLAIAADPALRSSDWPRAVRRVLGELLSYLGEHPFYAKAIAQDAFFTGADAVERILELFRGIAILLTEGAPAPAQSDMAVEGIAGALLHTIRCQAMSERLWFLGALSDYLSYVVLTPFIGAEAAAEIVTEEQSI
jgi:AcrR family transcriptional regulator